MSFDKHTDEKLAAWLKYLPERFNLPPKQEWSEEDEKTINDAIRLIERYAIDGHKKELREDVIGRLKSLRLQLHWKPNKEQMKSLKVAVDSLALNKLDTLYEDLKKL